MRFSNPFPSGVPAETGVHGKCGADLEELGLPKIESGIPGTDIPGPVDEELEEEAELAIRATIM